MQKSISTKYFVAAFAAVALFAAGYTYFGSDTETNNTAAKATITAPNSNYIENTQPAVQTGSVNVAPATGEIDADANTAK
jgi:hypothetical protein